MSPTNWQAAREKANQVRMERTRLHLQVREPRDEVESRRRVAQLLITTQPALNSMRALDLLRWSYRMHLKDAEELLTAPPVNATLFVTVGHLTVRQRLELMKQLCNQEARS